MPLQDAARLAASLPLAQAMREQPWLYPAVETLHIVGFAVLVGAVAMFDLPTGLLLFMADPAALLANRVFLLKLGLILVAGLNALAFHAGPWRGADSWAERAPRVAVLHALLSLGLWIAVIASGRLLAYF